MTASPAKRDIPMAEIGPDAIQHRASALVNSASGLANDYLNLFNEAVMLIEQLPVMPELMEDLLAWRPTTYQDYFSRSNLPGRDRAIDVYARLDHRFRQRFEEVVAELDRVATGSVVSIRRHHRMHGDSDRGGLAVICERAGSSLREILGRAVQIVNYGDSLANEDAQQRADRLMKIRNHSLNDVREFHERPRFSQD
jgi:hypothetical protein